MANPLKGEIDFLSDGKTYVLCFTTDAIVQVEQLLGQDISQISVSASMGNIRALLWGALLARQADINLLDAGAILDDFEGGVMEAYEMLVKALRFRLSRTPIDQPLATTDDTDD